MGKPQIYLVFTDDWELRGDGSGDIEQIQFAPMRRLLDIFEGHGMRGTFMVEMMQQLAFRREQETHPELKLLADRWDEHVCDAYRRGHDVQLHLHTQWSDASYHQGKWHLRGSWSILNYSPNNAAKMIADCRAYLENIIRMVDPGYRCTAFRASYLAAAPSSTLLPELSAQGIEIESSIVGGLRVDTNDVQFDYRDCDEDLLPYYPRMSDARRVSKAAENIVCLPIFHFTSSRISSLRQIASRSFSKLRKARNAGAAYTPIESSAGRSSFPAAVYEKAIGPLLFGRHQTGDVSRLDVGLLGEMLSAIRSRVHHGVGPVPVVVTNHSKNMSDFDGFDRFLGEIESSDDIECVTMCQVASMLREGRVEIRKD